MADKIVLKENPLITIISLSKYVTSDSKKKESILKKLKFSEPPKFTRYASPKSAIHQYLKDKERNVEIFEEWLKKEKAKKVEGPFKISDQNCCIESLQILKSYAIQFFSPYNQHYSKWRMKKQFTHIYSEGVDVSLSPDFAIYNTVTKELSGFIKLQFSKDKRERLTYGQGHLVTGLIKEHLEEQFQLSLNRRLCMVIDVFSKKVIIAPEDITWQKDRPKLIEAYKEIASVWPYLNHKAA